MKRVAVLFLCLLSPLLAQTGGTNVIGGVINFSGAGHTPVLKIVANVGAWAHRLATDAVPAFAALTTCASGGEGATVPVSDSSTATWGDTITGGGANHVLAYCNGTNWTVAAK